MIIPDTFFFVDLSINNKIYKFGPYLDIEHATIILIDILPKVAAMYSKTNQFSYEAKIVERLMDQESIWKEISVPVIENHCYKSKKTRKINDKSKKINSNRRSNT